MANYAMVIKGITTGADVVFKTKASSLKEAKEYFRKLKNLPEEDFNKLFIVTEVKQ